MRRPTRWFDVTWMALVGGAAVVWLSQSWLYLPHYEWRIASAVPLFLVLVPPCVRMSSGVMAACTTSIWQHTNRKPLVVAVYILLIVLTAGWSRSAVARDNLWIRISNNDMCVFSSSDQAMQLAWYHEPVRWAGPLVSVSSTPRATPWVPLVDARVTGIVYRVQLRSHSQRLRRLPRVRDGDPGIGAATPRK